MKNKKPLLCYLGYHIWEITYIKGPKRERTCKICNKIQSTMYDMSYGETYWTNGRIWSNK